MASICASLVGIARSVVGRTAGVLLGLSLSAAMTGTAQTACPSDRTIQAAVEYRTLVAAYREGETGTAVAQSRAMDEGRMNDVLAGVFAPKLCRDDLSWSASELRGAAMLEADVAISFLVADMFGQMMARLGIARAFVGHLGVSQSSFVQRWYVALSARLRLAGLISPWAGELLAWAREDQPHSPEILFESGRVAELTAAGAGALQIKQRSPIIPALADRERERFYSRNVKEGVEWLRESAARRPSAPGPRLHLARLLIASGSGSDATILLDPLAAQDGDVDSAYVARLFLGGLAEEGGDLEAALRLYDDAVRLRPGAQSALVAAGVALMKMGRTADARERLARLLVSDPKDEEIDDPWWGYLFDTAERVEGVIDELRQEVRR